MKNKFLKSLVVSAVSLCIALTTSASTFAVWPNCDKLNKNGQFDDLTCAIVDSVEKISNGEKFIEFDNVGYNSEYKLLFFDSSEINSVLSNLTYNKNVNQIVSIKEKQLKKSNSMISKIIYSIGAGIIAAKLTWDGYKGSKKVNKNISDNIDISQNNISATKEGFWANMKWKLKSFKDNFLTEKNIVFIIFSSAITVCIKLFVDAVNSYFKNKDINDFIISSKSEKDNYFLILKMMLNHLKDRDLTIDKVLCLSTDLNAKGSAVKILDRKSFKNYSQAEQCKFDNDIVKLKEEITSILSKE